MSGKFTPGPWKIVGYDGYGVNVWNVAGNKCIAERCSDPDARLIAAAPDMYEALKEIARADTIAHSTGKYSLVVESCAESARAALAKADGTL